MARRPLLPGAHGQDPSQRTLQELCGLGRNRGRAARHATGLLNGTGTVVELPKAKRKPGRPKGSKKWLGSGRQKGTVNRTTAEIRRYIHRNANPVGQVCKIAKGKVEIDGLSQADAIKLLYKAVIPELPIR